MKPLARRVGIAAWLIVLAAVASCGGDSDHFAYGVGGEARYLDTSLGRIKTETYQSENLSNAPILVTMMHGDGTNPRPSYQYAFAQLVTQGFAAPVLPDSVRASLGEPFSLQDVVAVGILRPGYEDSFGDSSDGDRGRAATDNFTAENVDAVAEVIRLLKSEHNPKAVIVVGHSGGATMSANILARHPGLADAGLLIACGCNLEPIRERMYSLTGIEAFIEPNRSLDPMATAAEVDQRVRVQLVVGSADPRVTPADVDAYAEMLRSHGVNANVTVVPDVGHNIAFIAPVLDALRGLVAVYEQ